MTNPIDALKNRMADFAYSDLPSAIKQGELDSELRAVGLVRKEDNTITIACPDCGKGYEITAGFIPNGSTITKINSCDCHKPDTCPECDHKGCEDRTPTGKCSRTFGQGKGEK